MRKPLIIIFICFIHSQCFAFQFTPEICQKYGLGKNWYCEDTKKAAKELSANEIMSSSLAPEEKAFELNKLWEQQRQRAVITANRQDIEKFLETHNLIINKGIDFAKVTQNLIETSPILANSENYYKNLSDQKIKEEEKQEILKNAHKLY